MVTTVLMMKVNQERKPRNGTKPSRARLEERDSEVVIHRDEVRSDVEILNQSDKVSYSTIGPSDLM